MSRVCRANCDEHFLQKQMPNGPNPWIETLSEGHSVGKEMQSGEKMETAMQPEIPSPSCGADERMREHREAITRPKGETVARQLQRWELRIPTTGGLGCELRASSDIHSSHVVNPRGNIPCTANFL